MSLKYVRTSLGEKGLPVQVFFGAGQSDGLAQFDDGLRLGDVLHPNRLGRKLEHLRDRHSHHVDECTVHADDLPSSHTTVRLLVMLLNKELPLSSTMVRK